MTRWWIVTVLPKQVTVLIFDSRPVHISLVLILRTGCLTFLNWKCNWRISWRRQRCQLFRHFTYVLETAPESTLSFGAVIPFSVYNSKRYVLIWSACDKSDQTSVFFSSWRKCLTPSPTTLAFDLERWRLGFINQFGIKYVELVTLDNLGRWIIMIVMRLVVFVPIVAHLNSVE
jgi:hypothetical protein